MNCENLFTQKKPDQKWSTWNVAKDTVNQGSGVFPRVTETG